MFAPEDAPGPVHRDCINAAMRMSNRTSADRATANTQPNARRRASSSFPLQFHCVMIGRSDAKATTPPMCQVRDSGETGTILEMQRWLCDRHARRELALLFKLLPSDDEDEADLDVVGKSNEVQDLSLEGGSALLPPASYTTQWKNTSDDPSTSTSFYVDLCHRTVPVPSGSLQPVHFEIATRNSTLGAPPSPGSDNDERSIAAKRKRSYIYDCTRCHRTFTSNKRAEEHVFREKCGGIVGKLARVTFPCPCNAFQTESEAGLRKHKQHCQGYGEWDPSNSSAALHQLATLPRSPVAVDSFGIESSSMNNSDSNLGQRRSRQLLPQKPSSREDGFQSIEQYCNPLPTAVRVRPRTHLTPDDAEQSSGEETGAALRTADSESLSSISVEMLDISSTDNVNVATVVVCNDPEDLVLGPRRKKRRRNTARGLSPLRREAQPDVSPEDPYPGSGRPQRKSAVAAKRTIEALESHFTATGLGSETRHPGNEVPEPRLVPKPPPARRKGNKEPVTVNEGWVVQTVKCLKLKREGASQCYFCVAHKAYDSCRFIGIRQLLYEQGMVREDRLVSNRQHVELQLPLTWNVKVPSHEQIAHIKRTVAAALLPILKEELAHISRSDVVLRTQEVSIRATCDVCQTSIFSGSWICQKCGKEVCSDCYATIAGREHEDPNMFASGAQKVGSVVRNHHYCPIRQAHFAGNFSPVSRFDKTQIETETKAMETLLASVSLTDTDVADTGTTYVTIPLPLEQLSCSPFIYEFRISRNLPSNHFMYSRAEPSGIPSRDMHAFHGPHITEDDFRIVWATGEPLCVDGLLGRFKIPWEPSYFIEEFGNQHCLIVDCRSETQTPSTVGEFFGQFGDPGRGSKVEKLKDWPPTSDFKSMFPKLFEDFSNAVPVPNYTRRDGILNIASHFPTDTIAPDLGPKMYNALEASEGAGSSGSTRLHMDMADAVNIMLYASKRKNGEEGFAAWNIFHADDANKIREFLREKHRDLPPTFDPIHSQHYFLDSHLRKELYEAKGVISWRVEQRPGEAVFIPAGCAHQVSNAADCIKVAVDFVSTENVQRCFKLTQEFREINLEKAWKDDVLQLRNMLWFAWLSCQRQLS